jgi:hypothetical protein
VIFDSSSGLKPSGSKAKGASHAKVGKGKSAFDSSSLNCSSSEDDGVDDNNNNNNNRSG